MKEKFQSFNFRDDTLLTIGQALEIISEYQADGFVLTLRQLYYQFVARGLIPNNDRQYKRLGSVVNNGRLAGLIDWEAIEDRTRNLSKLDHWTSPAEIIEACAHGYRVDLWDDQDYRVEVWIEKEALAGVIERICNRLDVPFFSCRGYVSQSEQWRAGKRFESYADAGQSVIVLHLGDHDPSGIDMTRDNQDRLGMFSRWNVDVERIALNFDQVEELNPPPNPAKLTDSRVGQYLQRFGAQSWELDALDPKYIERLIRTHVARFTDDERMEQAKARQESEREDLRRIADQYGE